MDALKRIPAWVGFLLLILTGILLIIVGATTGDDPRPIVAGAFVLVIGVLSWVAGGTSQVKGRVGTVGVQVAIGDLPTWAWIADAVLVVGMFVALGVMSS